MNSEQIKGLIAKIQSGDQDALNELLSAHRNRMFALAYAKLKDRSKAEDAVQRTMMDVCKGIKSFRNNSDFLPWMFVILYRQCAMILRMDYRWAKGRVNYNKMPHFRPRNPFEYVYISELRDHIKKALSAMGEGRREALLLCDLQGKTCKEASVLTNIPAGTMRSRVFYGRRIFRQNCILG